MSPRAPVDALTALGRASRVRCTFPYCLSKCPYCDFASTADREVPDGREPESPSSASSEARGAGGAARRCSRSSLAAALPRCGRRARCARVLELARAFSLAPGCEITLEANPARRRQALRGLPVGGVNRLSMGVQSFDAATLQQLGRAHDGPTAVRAFERARAAGFDNVSMDFIYGVHRPDRRRGRERDARPGGGAGVGAPLGLRADARSTFARRRRARWPSSSRAERCTRPPMTW